MQTNNNNNNKALAITSLAMALLVSLHFKPASANFRAGGEGDQCLELRETLFPCSKAMYGLFPLAPSVECCSALWELKTEQVCSCAIGPVSWKELLMKAMGVGGAINIPAALRIPFQCKVVHLHPGFFCPP